MNIIKSSVFYCSSDCWSSSSNRVRCYLIDRIMLNQPTIYRYFHILIEYNGVNTENSKSFFYERFINTNNNIHASTDNYSIYSLFVALVSILTSNKRFITALNDSFLIIYIYNRYVLVLLPTSKSAKSIISSQIDK